MAQPGYTHPHYAPVSLSLLSGFGDDDDFLRRSSSTTAVVNGGSNFPPPPARAQGGYKPMSQAFFRAIFDDDDNYDGNGNVKTLGDARTNRAVPATDIRPAEISQKDENSNGFQSPEVLKLQKYSQAWEALMAGFSDEEKENEQQNEDNPWDEEDDIYEASDRGTVDTRIHGLFDDLEPDHPMEENRAQRQNQDPNEAAAIESRQTDMNVAFHRNQESVAPADLPGYFAPDDLRFKQRYRTAGTTYSVVITNQRTLIEVEVGDQECIVCTDEKPVSEFPAASVTSACTHTPTTCLECVATSIRTDLNNKLWNEIKCPECGEILQYDDVQRFADEETKERYQTLSFRYAISEADNFLWCTAGCGYGQVHDGGIDQPIVICMLCNHRSCFHHKVEWHDNLTCNEYDLLQADPVNFRSRFDLDNEAAEQEAAARRAQEDADRAYAQSLVEEEQREAERERIEQERIERERRAAQEEEERIERERKAKIAREKIAKRKREEAATEATIGQTTKPCPGCGVHIEKNAGCAHMTCTSCKHQFCWDCMANYLLILESDNSVHESSCPWYPDNLEDYDGGGGGSGGDSDDEEDDEEDEEEL